MNTNTDIYTTKDCPFERDHYSSKKISLNQKATQ